MNTPLTTFDGFPRNDIDVAQSKGHFPFTCESADKSSQR